MKAAEATPSKARKHIEDIVAKRENDVLVGYMISGFPIGVNSLKSQMQAAVLDEKEMMPANLYPIVENGVLCGHYVDGLRDFQGNPIPMRDFHGDQVSTLVEAQQFIKHVEILNANGVIVEDWQMVDTSPRRTTKAEAAGFYLPKYMTARRYKYKDNVKITGFRIQGLTLKDINGNVYKYHKDFSDKNLNLEQKYRTAINHLKDMMELHRQQQEM